MENQLTKLGKAVKISIIAGILIVALSITYSLVYRPIQKQSQMKKCSNDTEKLIQWNSNSVRVMDKFKAEYDRCLREKGL